MDISRLEFKVRTGDASALQFCELSHQNHLLSSQHLQQHVLWEQWQTALIRPHPPSLPSISTLGVSSPAAQRWQTSTPSSNQCLLPLTLCFLLSLPFLLIFTMSNSFSLCLSAAGQPPCCSPLWNFRSGPGPWHLRRDVSSRLIGQRAEWCPHIRTARGGAVLL